ncbi:MAG TPA: glycosyltransferase [Candidatus Acidoferrum sp.]
MGKPFVSVLIDTYNHERFIEQAIVSVLEQDFPASEREILVIDDGSTDRTPEIVRKFEPHVRLLRKQNGGQASAFNAGIPECQGEIVAFLDGDDWWESQKLSVVVNEFAAHPGIGVIGHGLYEVDEHGRRLYSNVPDRSYSCRLRSLEEAHQFLELRSFLGTSRLAARRSVLVRMTPLPEALLVEADEFLATLGVAYSGCVILDQPLVSYRLHSANQFQFSQQDPRRQHRRSVSLECLVNDLPPLLSAAGITPAIVESLTLPNWIDSTRSRLALGGGWPWETMWVEREAFRSAYKDASVGYRLFHAAVLAAACLTPPRVFYKARHWYSTRRLARIRGYAGQPIPADSLVVRKVWS